MMYMYSVLCYYIKPPKVPIEVPIELRYQLSFPLAVCGTNSLIY